MPQIYKDPKDLLDKKFNFAIIEASNDALKPGFAVYYKMKSEGFQVYPVNPMEISVQDDPCFPNLTQLRPFPDVVVLPIFSEPEEERDIGMETLQEMRDMGIFRIWIEPDCLTDKMRNFLELHNMEWIEGISVAEQIDKMNSKFADEYL